MLFCLSGATPGLIFDYSNSSHDTHCTACRAYHDEQDWLKDLATPHHKIDMRHQDYIAVGLADALLDGVLTLERCTERATLALGQQYRWIKPLVKRVLLKFGDDLTSARRSELIKFIKSDRGYKSARSEGAAKLRIRHYFVPTLAMERRPQLLADCSIPNIPTPQDLAIWLGITMSELEWYADTQHMIRTTKGSLCHYNYKWIEKRHGYRLIESPKPRLREIQRKILREILDVVPAHPAAHGFRRGHSCVTYAAPHLGKDVVIRMDLRDFFMSIPARRVNALFGALGYPDGTARYLAGLCTNSISNRAFLIRPKLNAAPEWLQLERKKLSTPHLPQGAPTSPALANLCTLHFDRRLSALAERMNADYTRYADDIAFSGGENIRRSTERISLLIARIAEREGFQINFRKTRIMHTSNRQLLTGIVVNQKMNINRAEYDRLKATLHNCIQFSPESQNRQLHKDFRAHLQGRINYIANLNPARGQKLKTLFNCIEWKV